MRETLWFVFVFAIAALSSAGCGPDLPATTEGGGWLQECLTSFNGEPPVIQPGALITAEFVKDIGPNSRGDAHTQSISINRAGIGFSQNGRVDANWNEYESFSIIPECVFDPVLQLPKKLNIDIHNTNSGTEHPEAVFQCDVVRSFVTSEGSSGFVFTPSPVLTSQAPPVGTFTGQGFSTAYGMPLFQYYTMDGTLVAQQSASWVSADGTTAQISAFDISQLPGGTYIGMANNANPDGSWGPIGAADVQLADASVNIVGMEQWMQYDSCPGSDYSPCWAYLGDTGTVSVTVNGYTASYSYGGYDDATTISAGLASVFMNDASSPVTAWCINTTSGISMLMMSSKVQGAGSGYALSVSMNWDTYDFSSSSYNVTPSGPVL